MQAEVELLLASQETVVRTNFARPSRTCPHRQRCRESSNILAVLIRAIPWHATHFVGDKVYGYILQSEGNPTRCYTSLTSHVAARLAAHNAGHYSHTASGRRWKLIVSIEFATEKRALQFERYLKSGSGAAFAKRHFR
jgi:putative endonuclease